ncbi:MAG: hypothetical protein GY874_06360 [Desulfobacteraceae bacterium]|nr:hypothetical protein [Desulfobacteraceae bacterium]
MKLKKKNTSNLIVSAIIVIVITASVFGFVLVTENTSEKQLDGKKINRKKMDEQIQHPNSVYMVNLNSSPLQQNIDFRLPDQKKSTLHGRAEIKEKFKQQLVRKLQELYGKSISTKTGQAAILDFRKTLMSAFPQDWFTMFHMLLQLAFPEYVNEILETLSLIDKYNEWLTKNQSLLMKMPYAQMKETVRLKRTELFSEDAADIWPVDSKADEIRNALTLLKSSYETTIEEKIDFFSHALEDINNGEYKQEIFFDEKYDYTAAFITMDSVQEDFSQMTHEERAAALRNIRRLMGYSEQYLDNLSERDTYKENRWQNGLKYMKERETILNDNLNDTVRNEYLDKLRKRYFGHERPTIEAEENAGFFRYERRRVYGRN